MDSKLRIGVVGTSWWTDTFHLPSLSSHPRAQVAAICGRNAENAQALAKKYSIPHVFTDYHALATSKTVDALVIATPDDLHYPVTMAALNAGLHVLCEKPLASNAAEAREMYEKAEASGLKHMVYFTWSWMPHYQYVRQLIDNGFLGRPYRASFRFLAGFGRTKNYNWRYDPRHAHGTAADLGSHMIHLACCYLGDIVRVNGHVGSFVPKLRLTEEGLASENDDAVILLEFTNGAHAVIEVSTVTDIGDQVFQQQVLLHGEGGTLQVDFQLDGVGAGAVIKGLRNGEAQFTEFSVPDSLWGKVDRSRPFVDQILELFTKESVGGRQFVDAILENKPIQFGFEDGLRVQEVIDAILRSHKTGCRVSLDSACE